MKLKKSSKKMSVGHKGRKPGGHFGKKKKNFGPKKFGKAKNGPKKPMNEIYRKKEDEPKKSRLIIRDEDEIDEKPFSDSDEDADSVDDEMEDEENEEATVSSHKQTLERLKEKDPEFYQFLQSNDKELLDFDDDDDDDDFDKIEDDKEGVDDEDEAPEVEEKITSTKVNTWREILQNPESSKADLLVAIKSLIKGFRRTVQQTVDTSGNETIELLNPNVFNSIINSVLVDLLPALIRYLRLQSLKVGKELLKTTENGDNDKDGADDDDGSSKLAQSCFFDPRRSRNWKNMQAPLKAHLTDLLKMMGSLSAEARASFASHILEMTPFYNVYPHLVKRLVKRSIEEWSTGGESKNRVLAFLILHRMIRVLQQNDHLTSSERQMLVNQILRRLYLSYVGASKNMNRATAAQISFMKNSLVELYQLDGQLAYQHAFIFIRQLAIQLRNSYILKQKTVVKTVYNWQFVHSILLWTQLICSTHVSTATLDPLISPLVMVTNGTIRLLQSARFLPLRFTLIRAMIKLSDETETFIPVLSHFLEIYQHFNPNKVVNTKKSDKGKKKKKKGDDDNEEFERDGHNLKLKGDKEMKKEEEDKKKRELNLDLMLKVTKEETTKPEYIQLVIDKFYDLALAYLASQSSNVSYPEMVALFLHQSRKFVKTIHTAKERTKMRQLLDKVNENADWVFSQRKKHGLKVNEQNKILVWEREQKQLEATPLLKFYKKLKEFEAKNVQKGKEKMEEENVVQEANKELKKGGKREFNIESDVVRKEADKEEDQANENVDDEEADDEEDVDYEGEEVDDEDELDYEDEIDDEDEVDDEDEEDDMKEADVVDEVDDVDQVDEEENDNKASKRKRKNKNRKNKKARQLNSELQLDGAFELSSDDDDADN